MTYQERRERQAERDSRRGRVKPTRRRRLHLPPFQSILALLLVLSLYYGANLLRDATPTAAAPEADSLLRVVVIDVGQGSSTLLLSKDRAVLIDGGEPGEGAIVMNKLDDLGIQALDLVIASHPHSDHIGGLADLIGIMPVRQVVMPAVPDELIPTTPTYERFLDAVASAGSTLTVCDQPLEFRLGQDASLSIIGSFLQYPVSLNDCTLVVRADAGAASFLIMGDAEVSTEDMLRRRTTPIDADILVAGHHGSGTSSRQYFINAVSPLASAISVGVDNPFGHPHAQVLERLARCGPIYRTDLNGDIFFSTDGATIAVTAKNVSDTIDARG